MTPIETFPSEESNDDRDSARYTETCDGQTDKPGYEKIDLFPSQFPTNISRQLSRIQHQNEKLRYANICAFSLCIILAIMLGMTSWQATLKEQPGSPRTDPSVSSSVSSFFEEDLHMKYSKAANDILAEAELGAAALHDRLKEFCYTIGARLSGTPALTKAINWVKKGMETDGLEEVHLQQVDGVSHWVRGEESLQMLTPRVMALSMIGLGNSVAGNVTGTVVAVSTFEELEQAGIQKVQGKIVLFNAPFVSYGETVAYRVRGATAAAKFGAIAAIVRSISSFSMGNPHTGAMSYSQGDTQNVTRIPSAAVSTEHADMIAYLIASGEEVKLHLLMSGQNAEPALSYNVIGQLTGHSNPSEVVTIGGHIDSWDIGLGAMDDGAGLFVTWEAVRLLKALNLRPRRTVRVVAFVNEEEGGTNGVLGGEIYAKEHSHERHVMAIESDSGAFSPEGFYFLGSNEALSTLQKVSNTLLLAINATELHNGTFTGTDVAPLHNMYGTSSLELKSEASKYFWYHHSVADTPDKMDPLQMARCAATVAIMAFTVADLEISLA